jgi:hypothetical protein
VPRYAHDWREGNWNEESDAEVGWWVGEVVSLLLSNGHAPRAMNVVFAGFYPRDPVDLVKLLHPSSSDYIGTLPCDQSAPDLVVVGQRDVDDSFLDECLVTAHAATRFLPQERYLDLVLFGIDWWGEACELGLLDNACSYYPGLNYVREKSAWYHFDWPSVRATPVAQAAGPDSRERGRTQFNKLGYNVKPARSREDRWALLKQIVDHNEMSLEDVARTIAWY